MKTTKFISALAATAFTLAITPAWAMEQDTGYPWYRDLPNESPLVSKSGDKVEITIVPTGQDTGYPWFHALKEDAKAITKRVTIFRSGALNLENDSGYPWHKVLNHMEGIPGETDIGNRG